MDPISPFSKDFYLYDPAPKSEQVAVASLPFTPGQTLETHDPKSITLIRTIALISAAYFAFQNPLSEIMVGLFLAQEIGKKYLAHDKKHDRNEIDEVVLFPYVTKELNYPLLHKLSQTAFVLHCAHYYPKTLGYGVLAFFSNQLNCPFLPGLAIASYALYYASSQLLTQDPLLDAFHKIAGGKKTFETLPLEESPTNPNWEELPPLSRGKTKDGRQVLIVKAKPREKPTTQKTFIFMERANCRDAQSEKSYFTPLLQDLKYALFNVKMTKQTDDHETDAVGRTRMIHEKEISRVLPTDLANDLITQN